MADYCARSDIEDGYGVDNVKSWADMDADGDLTKIAARIAKGITWATAEIDDRMRGGRYALPLADATPATPTTVVRLCADLAGVWLYENRGTVDYNAETGKVEHRLQFQRDRSERMLREMRAGIRRLDAVASGSAYPEATEEEDD